MGTLDFAYLFCPLFHIVHCMRNVGDHPIGGKIVPAAGQLLSTWLASLRSFPGKGPSALSAGSVSNGVMFLLSITPMISGKTSLGVMPLSGGRHRRTLPRDFALRLFLDAIRIFCL
jgi:hypothetical protein